MATGDVISRLSVELSLNSAAFEKGAKKASKDADAFGDRMEAMGRRTGQAIKGIAAAGAALAAGFIVNQLKDMVVASLDYASSLGEVATQLGVTTSALQQYRYIATQVGIEQTDMDKGLSILTKNLGKMSVDTEKATKSLAKFGFSAEDVAKLSKMTAEQALPFLADKYVALTSVTEKAALASELFGAKLGAKMQTLLADGSKGINDMAAAYKKLGIELSPEMIQRADDAADKLSAIKQVLDAKMAMLVADNADKIIQLADAMVDGVAAFTRFYNAVVAFGDSSFGRGLSALNQLASLANPITLTVQALNKVSDAYDKLNSKPAPKVPAVSGGVANWPKASGGGVMSPSKGTPLGAGWGKGVSGKMGAGSMQVLSMLPSIEDINNWISEQPYMTTISEKFEKAFDGFAEEGRKATDIVKASFEDTANSVINSLGRMASSIKGGGVLDILSGVLDIGLQLAGIGAFGKKVQTSVNLPRYATGTNFHPGGMALVGERGPELVDMPRGSKVIPNNKIGGGGNVYNINGVITTDEFWGIIEAGNANAARGGAAMAAQSTARSNKWALGR